MRVRGFTLVELIVAIALMLILTGSIVFVFLQSQQIFNTNTETVKTFQSLRSAFDTMEQDLANVQKTTDMEFFKDTEGSGSPQHNGHYDNGEDLPGKENDLFRGYDYALTLVQRTYEDKSGRPEDRHRADRIYFRTRGNAGGKTQDILVTYDLVHRHPATGELLEHPKVRRIVQWRDNDRWSDPVEDELCRNATDLKIEFYFANRRGYEPGRFYSAKEAVDEGLVGDKIKDFGYPNNDSNTEAMIDTWNAYFYKDSAPGDREAPGYMKVETVTGRVYFSVDPTKVGQKARAEMQAGQTGSFLPMVQSGDRMFIYSEKKTGNLYQFEKGEFTISEIQWQKGMSEAKVYFQEDLTNKLRLPSGTTEVRVGYRAGWVPPAFKVTLRVLDSKAQNLRTVSRIFRVLGS